MDFADHRKSRFQSKRLKKLEKKEQRLLQEKKPSLLTRKVQQITEPVRQKAQRVVPQQAVEKSVQVLEKAFEKSFDLVLEKGSGWIGKLCSEQKRLQRYEEFSQKPLCAWELSRLGCEVAMRASGNMVFSSVQGGVMGVLGIGLPDVPIFLAAVFKTLFEISLSFGYPYDLPQEQVYQMLLICAAVGTPEERYRATKDADDTAQQIRMGMMPKISREQAKVRASKALCSAALAGKMVQGTPIVGVYGGFKNGVLLKRIGSMAAVKYQQRMLRDF